METRWCRDLMAEALNIHWPTPEIFNADQGAQYTIQMFTNFILERGMWRSLDGKCTATDGAFIVQFWRSKKYK